MVTDGLNALQGAHGHTAVVRLRPDVHLAQVSALARHADDGDMLNLLAPLRRPVGVGVDLHAVRRRRAGRAQLLQRPSTHELPVHEAPDLAVEEVAGTPRHQLRGEVERSLYGETTRATVCPLVYVSHAPVTLSSE